LRFRRLQTRTDFGKPGYGGPCPPEGHGPHRYQFTLFAVKQDALPVNADTSAAIVGFHLHFNTLEKAVLTGRKDETHPLVAISARSTAPAAAAEAQTLAARCSGWEFEIPDYKYAQIFVPLEELLAKPPAPVPRSKGKPAKAPAAPTPPPTSGRTTSGRTTPRIP